MSRLRRIKMTLVFSETEVSFLRDISSLFYDLELLHDLMILANVEDYWRYRFTNAFYYRTGRPVQPIHRMRVGKIVKESPLTIELVAATIGAFLVLIQAFEKMVYLPLNREKLRLEVKNLGLEGDRRVLELESMELEMMESRLGIEGMKIFLNLLRRLENNPLKLEVASFELIEENNQLEDDAPPPFNQRTDP